MKEDIFRNLGATNHSITGDREEGLYAMSKKLLDYNPIISNGNYMRKVN